MRNGDDNTEVRAEVVPSPSATAPLFASVVMIVLCIALGIFLVWIVNVSWVLEVVATIVVFGSLALAVVFGYVIYIFLETKFPRWASVTASVVLGLAIFLAVSELTRSHKLIRDIVDTTRGTDDE
jgi:uncharacterized membrane protein